MSDEAKELTLRVHDECAFVTLLSRLSRSDPQAQVTALMSSARTFVPASLTSLMLSRNASEEPSVAVWALLFISGKKVGHLVKSPSELLLLPRAGSPMCVDDYFVIPPACLGTSCTTCANAAAILRTSTLSQQN
jgi:hypothetical protein